MSTLERTLLESVVKRHGGLDRWNNFDAVTARLQVGGVLWTLKQQQGVIEDVWVRVHLQEIRASHFPFGESSLRTCYQPHRVAIEDAQGTVMSELLRPRESFRGHQLETPWTRLQLAYFAGYAMWTYLNTPFFLTWKGVETGELSPWQENGQTWRRLQATLPAEVPSHSSTQTFYFDDDHLLTRHDYDVDIMGGSPGAHFTSDYVDVSGILVPTRRWVLRRMPDGRTVSEPTLVSISLSEIEFNQRRERQRR